MFGIYAKYPVQIKSSVGIYNWMNKLVTNLMSLAICLSLLGNLAIVVSVRWLQEAHLVNTYEASAQVEKHSSLELFSVGWISLISVSLKVSLQEHSIISYPINA